MSREAAELQGGAGQLFCQATFLVWMQSRAVGHCKGNQMCYKRLYRPRHPRPHASRATRCQVSLNEQTRLGLLTP